jgi:hypothetical protein
VHQAGGRVVVNPTRLAAELIVKLEYDVMAVKSRADFFKISSRHSVKGQLYYF